VSEPLLARLVADGALSRGDAERAVARQELAGGSIDTALLELRLVASSRLPEVLARVTGLPAPPEAAFVTPDPRARRVFPAKVAERHGIAPFALDGRDLSVVTTYPPDLGLLDEIGFLLSLHLRAHVAPEWRVRALVHRLYGAPLAERLAALSGAAAERGPPVEKVADRAAVPAAAPPLEPMQERARVAVAAPAPAPVPSPGWTAAQAREALASAGDADAAIRVALRHARDFFSFAAVFSVRKEVLAGHDALGSDPRAREACRRLAVKLSDAGLLGAPLATHSPFLGPPPADPVTASILSGLGRVGPHTVLAAPVYVAERPACVLYADNDDAPVPAGRLGDLLAFLGALGASLEGFIRSRKAAAGERAQAPSAAGAPAGPPSGSAPPPGEPATVDAAAPPAPVEVPAPVPPPIPSPVSVDESWRVSEPARIELDPLPFSVDVDLGEYEVASAATALSSGRAEDLGSLVEALATSPPGSPRREQLVARLAEGGPEAAAALVARLPGPMERGADAVARPAEERGPIFAGTVALGRVAEKPLLAALEDADAARRRAAVALLARLGDPATLARLAARIQDDDPQVAAEAREALVAARGTPALPPVVADLRRALASGRPARSIPAARALGRLGDADSVPLLIQLLDQGGEVAVASADALSRITLQRLGPDPKGWIAWWREWRAAPRSSWLLQALEGPDRDLRQLAADELRAAGEPPVPYQVDAPEPERRRAARAWADWWREEGLAL
jgi:HEAT repeat protein